MDKRLKLKECCISISDGDHQPPPKQEQGIPFITISNFDGTNNISFKNCMYVSEKYYEFLPDIKKVRKGDVLYSVVGSFGIPILVTDDIKFVFQRHIAILRPNKEVVLPEYLYYLLLNPDFYRLADKYAIGAAQRTISLDSLRNMEVTIHSMDEQIKIVEQLSAIDKKIINNRMINDNLQSQMCLIYEQLMSNAASNKVQGRYVLAKELTEVLTGKEDANFSIPDGTYKFFTCSNIPLQCEKYAFNSSSVLIAGNGDFNVKHYSGKFNAYQRTYVLTPPKEYYALMYLASLYRTSLFKSSSSGSIVKFITKGDVENILLFIPDDTVYLEELNELVMLQERNFLENETLTQLRDFLLPMLMNGQVAIDD